MKYFETLVFLAIALIIAMIMISIAHFYPIQPPAESRISVTQEGPELQRITREALRK